MNEPSQISPQDPMNPPQSRLIGWLAVVFCFSFLFDFRGEAGDAGGGTLVQFLYLVVALSSTGLIVFLGWRALLVKPGVYLIGLWFGYLAWAAGIAILNGVPFGYSSRILLPPLLCGCGIAVAQISVCHGIRAQTIVNTILFAAVGNILWRNFYGFIFKGATIETARAEILSPALDWVIAYVACSLVLDRKLKLSTLAIASLVLGAIMLSVTRGLLFPIAAGGFAAVICLLLCIHWRALGINHLIHKAVQAAAAIGILIGFVVVVATIQPSIAERWTERLFHSQGGKGGDTDTSWVSRQAEAKAMWDILSEDPIHFIYGMGVGAGYYWDQSYYPELYLVYPDDFDFTEEFHFAGHSVWTYALFSGGVIGVLFHLALAVAVMIFGISGARMAFLSGDFNPAIAFLPFVAVWCFFSQSITSNFFDERLAGLLLGLTAGLPQAYFYRMHRLARAGGRSHGELHYPPSPGHPIQGT